VAVECTTCIPEVPTHQPVEHLIHTSLVLCEFFFHDFTLIRLAKFTPLFELLSKKYGALLFVIVLKNETKVPG